jgi:hypothetical protein
MTARLVRNDRIDATDSAEPTLKIEAAEPIEPIDRNERTEAIESAESREAIDSTEFSDHTDHLDLLWSTGRVYVHCAASRRCCTGALRSTSDPLERRLAGSSMRSRQSRHTCLERVQTAPGSADVPACVRRLGQTRRLPSLHLLRGSGCADRRIRGAADRTVRPPGRCGSSGHPSELERPCCNRRTSRS